MNFDFGFTGCLLLIQTTIFVRQTNGPMRSPEQRSDSILLSPAL